MIKSYIEGEWLEYNDLYQAIGLDQNVQSVVSLIGGGGKTTTMCRLQKEYEKAQIPTIVTTTTHIQWLDESWFLGEASIEKFHQLIKAHGKVWAGEPTPKGKLQSLPLEFLEKMIEEGYTIFIESDGARRLPCKAPGPNEPVFIEKTNVVLALYGMDAIGKKIEETCFRPEIVADILGKSAEERITPHDLAVLAVSERGGRKSVTESIDYQVILNKADSEDEQKAAKEIADELAQFGVKRIHMTSRLMDLTNYRFAKLVK